MNIKYEFDTISAIATPLGTGGVGIVRVSGDDSFNIIKKMFSKQNIEHGKIALGWILDNNTKIDEVVVLPFKAPKSFTGEDVIEIQCHGGVHVIKKILELTIRHGARLAERGEFTKRAFMNGRIDLSKAEAILDLIHARTAKFAQKNAQNLSGTLADALEKIRTDVFNLLSQIIAAIDFPEDVAEPEYEIIEEQITEAIKNIDKILTTAKSSNVMREGIKVAIIGVPNVGKSSLFNVLLNLQRAIVTEIAGTTRDIIQETLDVDGIPITLIDTAGIRKDENLDKVEAIGIDFSMQSLRDAELVLFVFDSCTGMQAEDLKIFELIKDKNHIKIGSKCDLRKSVSPEKDSGTLYISAVTNENIELLKAKIKEKVIDQNLDETEFVTNQRQQACLYKAKKSLETALNATRQNELQDLISIDVKAALLYLDEISGEVITDDILNNIFENFCIGK